MNQHNKKKFGVILANLGTPDSPEPKAIARYLWQFLTDPRVVDLPKWKWYPLLASIILPLRSKRIAKNYQAIWRPEGAPLLAISREQQQKLQQALNAQGIEVVVEIAMTYGNPSIAEAIDHLHAAEVDKVIVLPLYPQYSSTTTGAFFDAFANALKTRRFMAPFEFVHSYHQNTDYIDALCESIKGRLKEDEFLLFSYHGIPLRYEEMGDDYRQYCKETTLAVVDKLGLMETQWGLSFQSRFGREEWLQPYTDHFMQQAASQGIEKLAVICPGFSVDCLETLEEIEEENRTQFFQHGGKSYQYIPALNAESAHIQMMQNLLTPYLN